MQEFNKVRVYHINTWQGAGSGNGGGNPLLSSDFGDWLDLPQKSNQIFDEQLLIQYKLDLMSYPKKAILYLVGQFGLHPDFVGTEITLGVLPLNTRPKHQLIMDFTAQSTEIYLVIELNGEVKLRAVTGDLPVCQGQIETDPYFLNLDYPPLIEFATEYTAVRTQSITRNNCGAGKVGTAVSFSKTYTSNISQADANNKRTNDANFVNEAQAYANDPTNGAICEVQTVFYSTRTESFYRTNCPSGLPGSDIMFSKTYSSNISQADADNIAANDTNNYNMLGEAFANDPLNGSVCDIFYSSRTENIQRNNCGNGQVGSSVPFTKNYSSGISQQAANDLASNDPNFATEAQNFANNPANGATCDVIDTKLYVTIVASAQRPINPTEENAYELTFEVFLSQPLSDFITIQGGFMYQTYPNGGSGEAAIGPSWSITIAPGQLTGQQTDLTLRSNQATNPDTFTFPGLVSLPPVIDGLTVEFLYD